MHALATTTSKTLRHREAREIAGLLQSSRHVRIIGLDQSGKTTVLRATSDFLKDKNPIADNLCGDSNPERLARVTRADILLIDEVVTFCNRSHPDPQRFMYMREITRLMSNGAMVAFALHKDIEPEFERCFEGTERYLLNAQLSDSNATGMIRTILSDSTAHTFTNSAIRRFLEISGRTFYFIDKTLGAFRDHLGEIGSRATIDAPDVPDSLISSVAREPCRWIYRLSENEVALLKLILANQNVDLDAHTPLIRELTGLGLIEIKDGGLVIPGSAVRANFERTISLMETAV